MVAWYFYAGHLKTKHMAEDLRNVICRVSDLSKGDVFLFLGKEYKVYHIKDGRIIFRLTRPYRGAGDALEFGANSKQFVELLYRTPIKKSL